MLDLRRPTSKEEDEGRTGKGKGEENGIGKGVSLLSLPVPLGVKLYLLTRSSWLRLATRCCKGYQEGEKGRNLAPPRNKFLARHCKTG